MASKRSNPYEGAKIGIGRAVDAWQEGYMAAQHNANIEPVHGSYQHGVAAGRQIEQDKIGEDLILMAQEYGHAQFVFTSEDFEELRIGVDALSSKLAGIQDLR
jgi:hypothetical protein